jgi:hypothetical protein
MVLGFAPIELPEVAREELDAAKADRPARTTTRRRRSTTKKDVETNGSSKDTVTSEAPAQSASTKKSRKQKASPQLEVKAAAPANAVKEPRSSRRRGKAASVSVD